VRAGIAQSVWRCGMGWTIRGLNPVVVSFTTFIQTGPGAHPAYCTLGSGSVSPGAKRLEYIDDHPPHVALRLKKE